MSFSRTLEEIKRSGVLYVGFTQSWMNTINFITAQEFANFLNVQMEVVPITWDEIFSENGTIKPDYQTNPKISYTPDALKRADIICGTIYVMDWRKKFFDYAGMVNVSDLLIVRSNLKEKKGHDVKSYQNLKGLKIGFLENSSYENDIEKINKEIGGGIEFSKTSSEDDALALLRQGKVDGLITVSYLALGYIKNSKDFKLAFPVSHPSEVGWAVATGNTSLKSEIENFFATIRGNGVMDSLFRSKYGIDYSTYFEIINSYAQSQQTNGSRDLDEILESGKIVLALRDREMVYHKDGKKQFCHYLAEQFAKYLGVEFEIVITPKFSDYFEDDKGVIAKDSAYLPAWFNHFDVACDMIEPLDWRLKKVDIIDFLPNAKVVVGKKKTKIASINDLRNLRGVTSKGSSYENELTQNNIKNFYYSDGNDFIKDVLSGKADYTISNVEVFNLGDYPELESKFILGEINKMGWAIKKNQPKLRQKILEFIEWAKKNGVLDDYFKLQTGMTLKAAQAYLTVLHESYQEGYFPFVFYGTDDGIPQEDILSIFQDKDGYMWFGTYGGAVKYNGRRMHVFNTDVGLSNNAVYSIKQDQKGTLFFATLDGVSYLKENSDSMKTVFKGISFYDIFIDRDNNKWFYGDHGIFILDDKNKQQNLNEIIPTLPQKVHSISESPKSKDIAIAASEGLYILHSDNTFERLSKEYCHCSMFDIDNKLWTSTQTGLYYADKDDLDDKSIGKKVNTTLNLENEIIRKIQQTDDGSVWLTSDYNVLQILTLKQKPIVYDDKIGLRRYRILSFLIDNEDNMWFGFSGGMQKLTNKSLRAFFPDKLNSYINSIFEDSNSRIWYGMNNDLYYFKDKLVNFSDIFDTRNKSFVISPMPDKNIFVGNIDALYEIDVNTLKIKKTRKFTNPLFHLEDVFISSKGEIFLLTGINGIVYYLKNFDSEPVAIENHATRLIYQIREIDGKIYGGNSTGLVIFTHDSFFKLLDTDSPVWSLNKGNRYNPETEKSEDVIWVGTEKGLGYYKDKKFTYVNSDFLSGVVVNAVVPAADPDKVWLGTDNGVIYYNFKKNVAEFSITSKDGLPGNEIAIDGLFLDGRGILWIGSYHGVATFDIKKKKSEKTVPVVRIESIVINREYYHSLPSILKYKDNNITFEISGLSFKDEKSVEYEFYLRGLDNDYVASRGKENVAKYQNLPPGTYSFEYRAKGKDGIWSYFQSINFVIEKPFYVEWWFIVSVAIAIIALIWMLIKWRLKLLKKRNEHLEQVVEQRTHEIREKNVELEHQKEEILSQRDEIQAQRDLAESQRDEIIHQKEEIEASILYAKRIQNAILPPDSFINNVMPENFILFKPRDIVSGDYYWVATKDQKLYYAAADCTGHGVPGAFMSMLGITFLNNIISVTEELTASDILNRLRKKIIEALHQTGEVHEAKDGMDIALCVIDRQTMELQFAGAFNPLYLVRNQEILTTEADRMPIGIYEFEGDKNSFTNNVIKIQNGDSLYVFSDGYADQFGGKRGKKFMSGRFKKVLTDIQNLSMYEQRKFLDDTIENWRDGVSEQIDDILVIGVKI
jgi:ligand-binding sensor domain-containing protein/serine phosphatase RsbU (regulator of sigma subunit)/ABC-type amino acid transport substrate-binding protein